MVSFDSAAQVAVDESSPVLIFGGPYSNFHATSALHEEALRLNIPPRNIICTGDVVAYCASPAETVDLVRQWGIHTVQGNCEHSLGNDTDSCGCGFEEDSACDLASKQWFDYARRHIDPAARHWMKDLPNAIRFTYKKRTIVCLHGSDIHQSQFVFASSPSTIKQEVATRQKADIIVGGHCGLPFNTRLENNTFWLNAGVIGMPANDGNTHGWYMLIKPISENLVASWHRLTYDSEAAYTAMQQHVPHSPYAESLKTGLWPNMDILPEQERSQQGRPLVIESLLL